MHLLVHILPLIVTYIHCQVSSVCRRCITLINLARNQLKFVCLKLRLTHVFDFKWRRGQPCRWLSGTNNGVRAHVGDVIIVWRTTKWYYLVSAQVCMLRPGALRGLRNFFYNDFQLNVQELRLQARFFKGLRYSENEGIIVVLVKNCDSQRNLKKKKH